MRSIARAAVAASLGCALGAQAGRPMITDDARILDAKTCQLESWIRRNVESTEFWAVPACNPWGGAELTVGGAWTTVDGTTRLTSQALQAKTLFRPYEPGSWGIGIAAGTFRQLHREAANGWPGDAYLYVPVSFAAMGNDDYVVHVNGGATRHRDEDRTIGTWGLGLEARVNERLYFLPEIFALDRGRPFFQAGLRFWVVPSRMQVDASYGNRLASESRERWFSVGIHLQSQPWFP